MEIRLHNNCAEGWLFDRVNGFFKLKTTSANSAYHRNMEEHAGRASGDRGDLGHISCALALAALTAMCVTGCGIGNVQSHHTSRATGYHSRVAVGSREQSAGAPQGTPLGPSHIVASSWYGPGYDGHRTSSGERFDPKALTAASKTLPLGSSLRVTNLKNGRSTQVKINDRGPAVRGRSLDLSPAAAQKIGLTKSGVARVEITPVSER